MQPRELAGLQGQALGRPATRWTRPSASNGGRTSSGAPRRGRLHQLVHQARGRAARAGRGRQGQGLQAGPRLRRRHADLRAAQMRAAHPRLADRRTVRRQRSIYHDEFWPPRSARSAPSSTAWAISACAGPTDKARCTTTTASPRPRSCDETGLKKNGIEKLHPIVARGILIDVAAAKGVDMLDQATRSPWPT